MQAVNNHRTCVRLHLADAIISNLVMPDAGGAAQYEGNLLDRDLIQVAAIDVPDSPWPFVAYPYTAQVDPFTIEHRTHLEPTWSFMPIRCILRRSLVSRCRSEPEPGGARFG